MSKLFQFGLKLPEYDVPVLNEREARAAAGLFFFAAVLAFASAWHTGNFTATKIVVIAFFIDFFIRVLINPAFAPSLVLGRLAVRNQVPEYVGAPQKRFAWAIGLALSGFMMVLVVFMNVRGPINMLVCLVCLTLLFLETSFGICVGCKIYNAFNAEKAKLCPGGVCEIHERSEVQKVGGAQLAVVGAFVVALIGAGNLVATSGATYRASAAPTGLSADAEAARCKPPAFAVFIGHEDKWKLHNNCK